MAYEFKYRLASAPTGRTDGSGLVGHDIWAVVSVDGGEWTVVPGYHKNIMVPYGEVDVVMDMPDSTGPERQAKNQAYKSLLQSNLNTLPPADLPDWSVSGLTAWMAANDAAAVEAARVDDYIGDTLGQDYPVDFTL